MLFNLLDGLACNLEPLGRLLWTILEAVFYAFLFLNIKTEGVPSKEYPLFINAPQGRLI